jgi:hypothetical protein
MLRVPMASRRLVIGQVPAILGSRNDNALCFGVLLSLALTLVVAIPEKVAIKRYVQIHLEMSLYTLKSRSGQNSLKGLIVYG